MAAFIQPPPVTGSDPDLLRVLQGYFEALQQLQNPQAPTQLAEVALEADLPPAADWPNSAIVVTEHNCIAVSTDVAGTWTWLRADGGAF